MIALPDTERLSGAMLTPAAQLPPVEEPSEEQISEGRAGSQNTPLGGEELWDRDARLRESIPILQQIAEGAQWEYLGNKGEWIEGGDGEDIAMAFFFVTIAPIRISKS